MQQVSSPRDHSITHNKEAIFSHDYTDNDVAIANNKGKGLWKIDKAGDFGWGIFALKDYAPNEFIFRGKSIAF